MDTPIVLMFYMIPPSKSSIIRSIVVKEYFSKLTSNVEVLYPTQIHYGLLLCKSKRTQEKILNMRHILSNGIIIHLSYIPNLLFQQTKCSIDGQTMQLNGLSTFIQQCLPFLHATDGKIQVNPDGSIVLEGHIFILNSIHSFLINKSLKKPHSKSFETFNIRSGNLSIKVMSGKLTEQNVEGIIIPMSDKYKIHKAFEQQIQSFSNINFSNYFKDLLTKGIRTHEGEIILFSNREFKIPGKLLAFFMVPRISSNDISKDKTIIDSFQPTYEQMIYRALQTIDQNNIISLAMPVLEPHVKNSSEGNYANEMAVRAMVSAIRQFSHNLMIKLKRIIIVDHKTQIRRMSKRVEKYQKLLQIKSAINNTNNSNIDFDNDSGNSFANIFGIPKIPETISSASESDDDDYFESEECQLPYADHAKV